MKSEMISWREVALICQTIAGELVLNDLLTRLREVLLQSLTVQRGLVLLLEKDGYLVAVEAVPDNPQLLYTPFTKLEKSAQTMINRVIGTRQKMILTEGDVTFVIIPLLHQGRLAGICYLEMAEFNEEIWERLEAILGQTAVSLTNVRRFAEVQDQARLLEGEEAYRRLLQQKVAERTAEIEEAMQQLKATQDQLIVQENLASLGSLTSGIAHEIKNPLNFINNFAAMTVELTQELRQIIEQHDELLQLEASEDIVDILSNLEFNASKIQEQGKRADSIVRSMLRHSRGQVGERELTDVNQLLEDAINLAYHGARSNNINCDIKIEKEFETTLKPIGLVPQDMSRVFLNILSNACYAVQDKFRDMGKAFKPTIRVRTKDIGDWLEIRIRDNAYGIPEDDYDLIFAPFYSTKPTGEGTGLGLSLSYNIVVQGHQGKIGVKSELEKYTEFIICLPK
jgi:signal transduction histidine kinase